MNSPPPPWSTPMTTVHRYTDIYNKSPGGFIECRYHLILHIHSSPYILLAVIYQRWQIVYLPGVIFPHPIPSPISVLGPWWFSIVIDNRPHTRDKITHLPSRILHHYRQVSGQWTRIGGMPRYMPSSYLVISRSETYSLWWSMFASW